jgi:hypothetical protein
MYEDASFQYVTKLVTDNAQNSVEIYKCSVRNMIKLIMSEGQRLFVIFRIRNNRLKSVLKSLICSPSYYVDTDENFADSLVPYFKFRGCYCCLKEGKRVAFVRME